MAWTCTFASCTLLVLLLLGLSSQSCHGLGTFGFDIHHRYSDPVKAILGSDGLPEKGSIEYYAAMARRDRIIRGRHLAATNNQSPLTFANGNMTFFDPSFIFLYYANVSVGTPSLSFLVALDTGSRLFWLPCGCLKDDTGCQSSAMLNSGEVINLNIYNPNASSTSENVPCNSALCTQYQCASGSTNCAYSIYYGISANSSSSAGILVEDVLHLITDDDKSNVVDSKIPFGCGQYLYPGSPANLPPNGMLGLGINNISVPSILASNGLVSNSFSMCFGADDLGRITFGDTGSSDQKIAPFTIEQSVFYNINISQITVESNVSQLDFSAIFDSGTTFTTLKDPAYTIISTSFDSQVKEYRSDYQSAYFEYCYSPSIFPEISLTLEGGNEYVVTNPVVVVNDQGIYCLAIVKIDGDSENNIIGQNFMTGYHIVFNGEKQVIGWKASDCGYSPSQSPPTPDGNSSSPPTNPSQSFTYALTMLLVSFFFAIA